MTFLGYMLICMWVGFVGGGVTSEAKHDLEDHRTALYEIHIRPDGERVAVCKEQTDLMPHETNE